MVRKKREALILLVTGGREYEDEAYVSKVLKSYQKMAREEDKVLVVVQGGARGLDRLVKEWCAKYGVPCIQVDAHWNYYHNSAGPIRNGWMIEFCNPTHCHVFPGGTGTRDMGLKALLAGLIVDGFDGYETLLNKE